MDTKYGYDESALSPVAAVQHSDTRPTTRGNLTSVTKCNPVPSSIAAGCSGPKTTYTYDTTGQLASMTDPLGHTTTFSFADSPAGGNSAGNTNAYLTNIKYPGGTLQKSFQYDYKYAVGYLIASIDENNQPTTYTYADALYRPTEVDYPDGGITKYAYSDTELSPTVTTSKLLDAATGQWETSIATMDGMGHVVETDLTTDSDGPTMVTTSYDGEGHPRVVSNPYRSSPDGYTTYYYDAFGKQIKTVKQDGNIQQWCYNGVASTPAVYCSLSQLGSSNSGIWVDFTDENVNHWERVYNVFGDLTKVMEPNGTAQSPSMETDYAYDALSNLLNVTQRGGPEGSTGARVRTFNYDNLSRLLCSSNPENSSASCPTVATGAYVAGTNGYSYDANSNVSSKTDARGVRISYTYDALNRLLRKSYSDGITPSSCYQYGTSSSSNSNGRLSAEWTQSGNCSETAPTTGFMTMRKFLAYDSMGRILSEQQCTPNASGPGNCTSSSSNPFALSYLYNQAGNLSSYTSGASNIPTVGSITFGLRYDGADRLQSLNSSWNPAASSSGGAFSLFTADPTKGYTPAGAIWNVFLGNDIYVNKTYDNRLRITGETATHP